MATSIMNKLCAAVVLRRLDEITQAVGGGSQWSR